MRIELRHIHIPGLFRLPKLDIAAGEKVLIQGPSGKGKTTLLHLIGGILIPPEGEVRVDGKDLYKLSDRELSHFRRKKIGLIYQKLNLIEHLTGLENMQLISQEKNPSEAQALLKRLGLSDQAHRWVSSLSLGEQQRIAIGRVLLQKPDLLLADEPTSSLDHANTDQVMELLLEASRGKTLIVVSHDERIGKHFDRLLQLTDLIP